MNTSLTYLTIINSNLRWLSPAGLDLAEKLLAFDPLQRVSAEQALEAPYFNLEAPPSVKPDRYVLHITVDWRI